MQKNYNVQNWHFLVTIFCGKNICCLINYSASPEMIEVKAYNRQTDTVTNILHVLKLSVSEVIFEVGP